MLGYKITSRDNMMMAENEVFGAGMLQWEQDQASKIVLAEGRRFKIALNVSRNTFELQSADDRTIVQFDVGGSFRLSANVQTVSDSENLVAVPWLMPFAWYLYVTYYMDSLANTAVLIAASAGA